LIVQSALVFRELPHEPERYIGIGGGKRDCIAVGQRLDATGRQAFDAIRLLVEQHRFNSKQVARQEDADNLAATVLQDSNSGGHTR
jgi:hypothetical protein